VNNMSSATTAGPATTENLDIDQLRAGTAEYRRAWNDVAAYDASQGVSEPAAAGWRYSRTLIAGDVGVVHEFMSRYEPSMRLQVEASAGWQRAAAKVAVKKARRPALRDSEDGIDEAGWDRAMVGGAL
jgi:hypothetical protein